MRKVIKRKSSPEFQYFVFDASQMWHECGLVSNYGGQTVAKQSVSAKRVMDGSLGVISTRRALPFKCKTPRLGSSKAFIPLGITQDV
jgi:hypothetical protein